MINTAHGNASHIHLTLTVVKLVGVKSVFQRGGGNDRFEYRSGIVCRDGAIDERGTFIVQYGGDCVSVVCGKACHSEYFTGFHIGYYNCATFKVPCGRCLDNILDMTVDGEHDAAVGMECGIGHPSVRSVQTSAGGTDPAGNG